jgi:GTPase
MTHTNLLKKALDALVLNNKEWKNFADSGDSGFWRAEDQEHYQKTAEVIAELENAFEQVPVRIGTIGHIDNGKATLTASILSALQATPPAAQRQ